MIVNSIPKSSPYILQKSEVSKIVNSKISEKEKTAIKDNAKLFEKNIVNIKY